MKVDNSVELAGPFFTVDVKKTFRANCRVMLNGIAAEGQAQVRARVHSGPAPVHIADHIIGRTVSQTGKQWQLTAVISNLLSRTLGRTGDYGKILQKRTRFFWRGIQKIRKQRREAERLLRGLE